MLGALWSAQTLRLVAPNFVIATPVIVMSKKSVTAVKIRFIRI